MGCQPRKWNADTMCKTAGGPNKRSKDVNGYISLSAVGQD